MGLLRFLFGERPDAPEPEEPDPMVAVLEAVDHFNSLVHTLPRGISPWISYEPGKKGQLILRRREFSEAVQIYPQRPQDALEEVATTRRRARRTRPAEDAR